MEVENQESFNGFLNKNYPDNFPEGCPPIESIHEKLVVYRLVEGEVVAEEDFKSFMELGRDARDPGNPFIEYGLSVNASYEDLKKYWRGSPALKKKFKNICIGKTYLCTGVIKATPSKRQKNHYTWWLYKDINPSNFFEVVKVVNN